MSADAGLRDHVARLLTTAWAHVTLTKALEGVTAEQAAARLSNHPHTLWQLLEHLRICQQDLVEYSRSADYTPRDFPKGYWPEMEAPSEPDSWEKSAAQVKNDLQQMVDLVSDQKRDLLAPLPWSKEGHTLLREALILADHNAYHGGQIVQLKRALGIS